MLNFLLFLMTPVLGLGPTLRVGMSVQWLRRVQLFVTPWTVAHQVPNHGISQARILECVAISSSDVTSRTISS